MPAEELQPSRYPSRFSTDQEALFQVLDEGLYCTVAYIKDGVARQIPTGFCRVGTSIYIHASSKSSFIDHIMGQEVSFSITLMDALVLAPTAFDHSFNYRSVIGFSRADEVADEKEKLVLFRAFTDRYLPGRIADVGDPTMDQVRITRMARLSLDRAGLKARSGDAGLEGLEKYGKWVGVIPVASKWGTPIVDDQLKGKVDMPDYIKQLNGGAGN